MDNIEKLFTFFKDLRTLVYTSNIVENYNSVIGGFPTCEKKSFNNINQFLLDLYVHFGNNPRYKKLNQKARRVRNWYRIYE
ncbi:transposase [Mycoplasmoides gallisepticum]